MAVDALYEVTLRAVMAQQVINNVFYYERDSTAVVNAGIPEVNLSDYFENVFLPNLQAATSVVIDYRGTLVREVFPSFGFLERVYPENTTGNISGNAYPPFNAMELYTARTRGDVRAGYKRFAGVPLTAANNGILTAAQLVLLGNVRNDANAVIPIEEGGNVVGTLRPRIVKRIKDIDEEGNVTYRLPENLAEYIGATVNYVARERITTQNSRKIGRGV